MSKFKHIWNCIFAPTSIMPIRFVLLVENMLCFYRNLDYYRKRSRVVIYFRIAIEIAVTTGCFCYHFIFIYDKPSNVSSDSIYFYMNAVNSIVIILLACYYSKVFKELLSFIEENNKYFLNDEKYQNYMRRQDYAIKCGVIFFILYSILAGLQKAAMDWNDTILSINIAQILFDFNAMICTFRNICEYIALYAILYVMSEQVECITRAVSKKRISIATVTEQWDSLSDEDSSEIKLELREFDELSTIFSNIKACSKFFNKIFGLQLVLMLGSATAYCIMFLYTMAFIGFKGKYDVSCLLNSILKLLIFFLLLLLLSLGAQRKLNNVKNLRRQLGKLLIDCVNDDSHYKATKDFLRLVSIRSVKTETLGCIDVDMSLIPSFIMFITSYTVIALQFNNVV